MKVEIVKEGSPQFPDKWGDMRPGQIAINGASGYILLLRTDNGVVSLTSPPLTFNAEGEMYHRCCRILPKGTELKITL